MKIMCVAKLTMVKKDRKMLNGKVYTCPEIGDECTVIESNKRGELIYLTLAEHDYQFEYDSRAFATLPTADAEEIDQQEKEAIVNIETEIV